MTDVLILGAGIQGCLAALELAERGHAVRLLDKASSPMTAASRWNEGKVHLGYLYANDPTQRTAGTLIEGAIEFAAILQKWVSTTELKLCRSTPFTYAVHRDTLVEPDAFLNHCLAVDELLAPHQSKLAPWVLCEERPRVRELTSSDLSDLYNGDLIIGAVEVPEISLDPSRISDALTAAVRAHPRIEFIGNTFVQTVSEADGGFLVEIAETEANPTQLRTLSAPVVVNALWSDRLRIDAGLGLIPTRPWMFRYKLAAFAPVRQAPRDLPSTTIVLGPFGDLVNFQNRTTYLSWYPVGRIGLSRELSPKDWYPELAAETKRQFWREYKTALGAIIPALNDTSFEEQRVSLEGGVIFAWGDGDVEVPGSAVHQRFDIGLLSRGNYHSIDTGKWSMAALFAKELTERID